MINLAKTIDRMTKAGRNNLRCVLASHSNDGYIIEINDGGVWSPIVKGITKSIAEDLLKQASNRVICG